MEQNINEFGGRDRGLEEQLENEFKTLLQPAMEYLQELCENYNSQVRVLHNANKIFEWETTKMLRRFRGQEVDEMNDIPMNEGRETLINTFKKLIK